MDPTPPVAPPRKKRPSMLSHDGRRVKNGFKDVFGIETPRRFSCDSVDNATRPREMGVDVGVPLKQSISYDSTGFADFSQENSPTNELDRKVLPRVGNKKSDKFFGENLSDCLSDEYVSDDQTNEEKKAPKDAIEKFVEENAVPVEKAMMQEKAKVTKTNSLDKKAEFLMAMLDGYSEEEAHYAGRTPVEEPIIVPKRKPNKHICDDDDHMHHRHFHKHEIAEASDKSDTLKSIPGEPGPKKPERDLSKYRKSLENLDDTTAENTTEITQVAADVEKPARKKRSISREDLPSPPPRPVKTPENVTILEVGATQSQAPPISPKPKPLKKIPSMPNNLVLSTKIEPKRLQKCQSSGSLVPEDLMSEIKRRVYEFQISQEYLPEDHSRADGSELVKPQSKLEKRKVSVTKKISNASSIELDPILDEDLSKTKFSIGNTEVKITEEVKEMAKEPRGSLGDISETANAITEFYKSVSDLIPDKLIENSSHQNPPQALHREIKEDHFVAPVVTSTPAKKDFATPPIKENALSHQVSQEKAEDSLKKILQDPEFDVNAISSVLEDIYANNKSILEDFQSFLEVEADSLEDFEIVSLTNGITKESSNQEKSNQVPAITVEKEPERKRRQSGSSNGSISDDNYTDLIEDTPKEQVTNKTLLAIAQERGRRESIDDVNNWFDRHIDSPLNPKIQTLLQEARKGRRGSDFVVYDTTTLYPFGNHKRHGSESGEFFDNLHPSKSADNVARDKDTATEEDHSNLLKFLKREAHADRAHSVPNND
ncbi:muscle M-line assembly protein unc-89-like isoform X2 [Lutzomyia longipalpis]|nr:muscle M-line assembly protein unc-89-like isoform X2 [Lutzomyia longipalpis]